MEQHSIRTAALTCAALTAAASLQAQAVRGVVGIAETREPVSLAAVVLVGPDGRTYSATLTNASGTFSLQAPESGHYLIQAYAPGFAEAKSKLIELLAGRIVEVQVNLQPRSETAEGFDGGFGQRRDLQQSERFRTFNAQEIQRLGAANMREVLGEVPLSKWRCHTVWLDGQRLDEGDWRLDWLMGGLKGAPSFPLASLFGVEVFRTRADAPERFQLGGSEHCGVVLVWTKPIPPKR